MASKDSDIQQQPSAAGPAATEAVSAAPKRGRRKAAAKPAASAKATGAAKTTAAKRKKKNNRNLWRTFKDGRALSLSFFKRNGWLIILVMVAVIWLISQRYSNQSKMQQIKQLERELKHAESDKLDAKSDYMTLIRENEMRTLMRENHLDLDYQEQPPYIIPAD
jgi:hypothetical protein